MLDQKLEVVGFLKQARREAPDCLIVDLVLPGMSGLELHEELVRMGLNPPTILLMAMKAGVVDCLTKPYDADALLPRCYRQVS